ncbi:MAG: isoprenylcysteine carboxylmethyltransferase family protein [Acidobacteria bacterium]|nr:isoprenylcysteine carboxylmethyltransferase family protein [Acidobacteriota bacterium]
MLIVWIWKILFWAWIASEIVVVVITRTRRGNGKIQDRGSMFVLWGVIFSAIYAGEWIGAVYRPSAMHAGHWLSVVAVVLLAVGVAIRWTAILTLGKSFSVNVAIHATQTLHKTGLFRYMRHPSYTGMLVIFLAMGLATRNWLGLAIIVVFPLVALLYRMHVEEAALAGAFGTDYAEYSRSTKRLIPGIY